MTTSSPENWFEDWFDEDYLKVYAHRDESDARAAAAFAATLVPPTARILDLACGAGRHLRECRALGLCPIGLDLSPTLLGRARAEAAPLVRADMRCLPFRRASFDLVLSLFTSFGYFDDDSNRGVLGEMARVVRTDGFLVLDVLNRVPTVRELIPHSRRRVDELEIEETRLFDPRSQRVEKAITLRSPRGTRQITESVRAYDRGELEGLLADAGFQVESMYADFDRQALSDDSRRLVALARRNH